MPKPDACLKPVERPTDTELITRILAGDMRALEEMMRLYNRTLYRTARAILRDDAEAQDAVQEAYLRAYGALGRFRGDAKLSTWLVRITANEALMRRLLQSRIDALPEGYRTVFVLRGVEELSVEETAAALHIPEATVRSRFFRARGLLRAAMAGDIDVGARDAFSFAGLRCDRIVAFVLARTARAEPALC